MMPVTFHYHVSLKFQMAYPSHAGLPMTFPGCPQKDTV